jgi:hypothetical protein
MQVELQVGDNVRLSKKGLSSLRHESASLTGVLVVREIKGDAIYVSADRTGRYRHVGTRDHFERC